VAIAGSFRVYERTSSTLFLPCAVDDTPVSIYCRLGLTAAGVNELTFRTVNVGIAETEK
jgi:hypothetical protein